MRANFARTIPLLTLRRPRSGRLEGWQQSRWFDQTFSCRPCGSPPFETRACGALLRVRSSVVRAKLAHTSGALPA